MQGKVVGLGAARFPVVAIGASAGGLAALRRLISALPKQVGAALIIVQHQLPDHQTMLADIAAPWTALPIALIEGGERLRPNHVYVAPAGHVVTLERGMCLRSEAVRRTSGEVAHTVDALFVSLARLGPAAVAIVLSGAGSDGAAGAAAVKHAGGVVFAQLPQTAEFASMPNAVIASGVADHVLSPEDIAGALAALAVQGGPTDTMLADIEDREAVDQILALLRTRGHLDLRGYKAATTVRRIRRRMEMRSVKRWSDYSALLRTDEGEVAALARDALIHLTTFFRDEATWQFVERDVLPGLFAERGAGGMVRAWSTLR